MNNAVTKVTLVALVAFAAITGATMPVASMAIEQPCGTSAASTAGEPDVVALAYLPL
jgi:hypothetical protein